MPPIRLAVTLTIGLALAPIATEAQPTERIRGGALLHWPQDLGGASPLRFSTPIAASEQDLCGSGAPDAYRIDATDLLRISVSKNESTSRTVPVRPDGKISLPLINHVQAAGLTALELRDVLSEKLREYMPEPVNKNETLGTRVYCSVSAPF